MASPAMARCYHVAAARDLIGVASSRLDLFDAGADAPRTAAAIRHRGPQDETAVIALYSAQTHVFTDVHARLIEEAVSLEAARASIAALTGPKPQRWIRRVG